MKKRTTECGALRSGYSRYAYRMLAASQAMKERRKKRKRTLKFLQLESMHFSQRRMMTENCRDLKLMYGMKSQNDQIMKSNGRRRAFRESSNFLIVEELIQQRIRSVLRKKEKRPIILQIRTSMFHIELLYRKTEMTLIQLKIFMVKNLVF